MKTAIIVPGRLASTRFQEKLLHPILGTPLILLTARRIQAVAPDLPLIFAVDDRKLVILLESEGFDALLTDPAHNSGTDRIAEANETVKADFVINVQADEPLVTGKQIQQLADAVQSPNIDLATLAHPFESVDDFQNPNQVKVVINTRQEALYFSRSPIPFARDFSGKLNNAWLADNPCYRHLGLYAYSREFLSAFTELPASYLEITEKLEQLRALENGYRIAVRITHEPTIGIDAPEDVKVFEKLLSTES